MADHWWWRPGWQQGTRFLTWHLTFDGQAEVHRLAEQWRGRLAPLPGLDLVPDQWLHLTVQGVGFAGRVSDADAAAVVATAEKRLAVVSAFEITIDRPAVTPEAIRWEAEPGRPVATVRDALRAAIADVWSDVPEPADGFAPHISIAYSNSDGPAAPVLDTVAAAPSAPARARITSAELILLHRDRRMYEWETVASVPLNG